MLQLKVNRFHSYSKMKPPPLTLVRLHVIHKRLMRYCFNLVYHRPTRLLLRDIYLCVCLLCMTGVKEFAKLFLLFLKCSTSSLVNIYAISSRMLLGHTNLSSPLSAPLQLECSATEFILHQRWDNQKRAPKRLCLWGHRPGMKVLPAIMKPANLSHTKKYFFLKNLHPIAIGSIKFFSEHLVHLMSQLIPWCER